MPIVTRCSAVAAILAPQIGRIMMDVNTTTLAADGQDAELIALGAELGRRWAVEKAAETDEDLDATAEHSGEIAWRIMSTPAQTLQGYRVKAQAVAWAQSGEGVSFGGDYSTDLRFAEAMLNDLLRVA